MPDVLLAEKIKTLPVSPGIYMYKDATGNILYVGKAKHLKNRVRSYFGKSAALEPAKIQMVQKICTIETIATDTELEALVLEANLIRKHQPPYNVLLRDDKYYLFIKITREEIPRIFPVRRMTKDGSRYFGPYSSATSVRSTLRLLQRIFPFKGEKDTAHDIIFPHPLFSPREKSALSELGKSKGASTEHVIHFLKGNRQEIISTLEQGIAQASKNLEFERAALFRDQLQAIVRLEGFQKVYLSRKETFDVISIARDRIQSAANILQIREGKLLGKQTFLLHHRTNTRLSDTVRQFLLQYYSVAQDIPKEILIPCPLEDKDVLEKFIHARLHVPQRGARRQLLAMGETNAKLFLQEQGAIQETKRASKEALAELLKAIGIALRSASWRTQGHPFRVETYDISNIQGKFATASMVVFVNGMPAKDQYRKFKINTQGKPNDFAMLEETLTRRLARDDWPLPDLIIIDGGKGQLSSTQKALKKSGKNIPIISIAKREEEIFLPNQKSPVLLAYDSPALYLIQRMRDEAHRFTITYHKKIRSKEQTKSILDEIPSIGPKTKRMLMQTFGSVQQIKAASDNELEQLIGKHKTTTLREHL